MTASTKWIPGPLLRILLPCIVLASAEVGPFASLHASDWARFRGPNGSGVSPDLQPAPVTWSPTENLRWKVALPGRGVSCPIVVGDRVYVTCYSGYGVDVDNPGQPFELKRHLVCLDRTTGKIDWEKVIPAEVPEDPYVGMGVPQHGYASHTPASDGTRIYVFFGKSGVYAFDMLGEEVWHARVGTGSDPRQWGSASSLMVHENTVIVTAGPESRAIVGLDATDGKELWRAEADSLGNMWGTPLVVRIDDDRSDIVLGAPYEIWGLNPQTGKLRWYCEAIDTDQFNSSLVLGDGVVFAIEGRGGGSIAVRADGRGDITETHVVWKGSDSNRFGTPLFYEGRLYFVANGIAKCLDAHDGKTLFSGRLQRSGDRAADAGSDSAPAVPRRNPDGDATRQPRGRRFGGGGGFGASDYASPVAADGKIYYVTRDGNVFVFAATDSFQQLASNRVTDDTETFSATPAISNGELFLRSDQHLYCISAAEGQQ